MLVLLKTSLIAPTKLNNDKYYTSKSAKSTIKFYYSERDISATLVEAVFKLMNV